ncbi:phosphatase PAP2 family protein [Synechococcus moorigangaii CMS01]|nr:phosphatase PAP2 family protein [Synechococcus moorigangaii CMS01]
MLVIEFLQGLLGERFLGFFLVVTHLGGKEAYIVLLGLYYWLIDPRQGRLLTLILTVSVMSNIVLKQTFALPRPYVLNPAITTPEAAHTASSFSFPSGHAQGITTFWGAIAFLQQKVWLWITAVTIILLVCLSRLYLGVHFPRDVAAGAFLGVFWIILGLRCKKLLDFSEDKLWQKIGLWGLGGLGAIAWPEFADLIGIFCGFAMPPSIHLVPPQHYGAKIRLGVGGLVVVLMSYFLLKGASLWLPESALVDYGRYLAIALIVTEGIPRLWQCLQPVR